MMDLFTVYAVETASSQPFNLADSNNLAGFIFYKHGKPEIGCQCLLLVGYLDLQFPGTTRLRVGLFHDCHPLALRSRATLAYNQSLKNSHPRIDTLEADLDLRVRHLFMSHRLVVRFDTGFSSDGLEASVKLRGAVPYYFI